MAIEQKTQVTLTLGFTDDQLREALRDIFRHYGYDPDFATTPQKAEIAKRLSEVAEHVPAWGYLYVHNFMRDGVKAGQQFKTAIINLASMIDGAPLFLIKGRTITVTALGNITPGAIVYGDSRKCANISCVVHFVPRVWNQKYCSPSCKHANGKALKEG